MQSLLPHVDSTWIWATRPQAHGQSISRFEHSSSLPTPLDCPAAVTVAADGTARRWFLGSAVLGDHTFVPNDDAGKSILRLRPPEGSWSLTNGLEPASSDRSWQAATSRAESRAAVLIQIRL